jgi:hypothetical protein
LHNAGTDKPHNFRSFWALVPSINAFLGTQVQHCIHFRRNLDDGLEVARVIAVWKQYQDMVSFQNRTQGQKCAKLSRTNNTKLQELEINNDERQNVKSNLKPVSCHQSCDVDCVAAELL